MKHYAPTLVKGLQENLTSKSSFDPERKARFLEALHNTGMLKEACAAVDISRATVNYHFKTDSEFRLLFSEAIQSAGLLLEDEARHRAVQGVEETIYFKGDPIGKVTKYSDWLLTFLLRGHYPKKYGNWKGNTLENPLEDDTGDEKVKIDFSKFTDSELVNLGGIDVSTADNINEPKK